MPILVILVMVTYFIDYDTVETIDLDSQYSEPRVSIPKSVETPASRRETTGVSRLRVSVRYASLDDLVADQQAAGFVKIGTFGNHWPATVTEIQKDRDSISFTRQDGSKHSYAKFDGYTMKMVRLQAQKEETIIVFRSAQKR